MVTFEFGSIAFHCAMFCPCMALQVPWRFQEKYEGTVRRRRTKMTMQQAMPHMHKHPAVSQASSPSPLLSVSPWFSGSPSPPSRFCF